MKVRWRALNAPTGTQIDAITGVFTWDNPIGSYTPYDLEFLATSLNGSASVRRRLLVEPSYNVSIRRINTDYPVIYIQGEIVTRPDKHFKLPMPIVVVVFKDGTFVDFSKSDACHNGTFNILFIPPVDGLVEIIAVHPADFELLKQNWRLYNRFGPMEARIVVLKILPEFQEIYVDDTKSDFSINFSLLQIESSVVDTLKIEVSIIIYTLYTYIIFNSYHFYVFSQITKSWNCFVFQFSTVLTFLSYF